MPTLVVGSGLLGRAVLRRTGSCVVVAKGVAWDDPSQTARQLRAIGSDLASRPRWRAAWCAGAAVVGASSSTMRREVDALRALLDSFERARGDGRLFVVSSAGGVHGGGGPEIVTEASDVRPRSAYGEGKVALEAEVATWASASGVPTLIGRISNLYGPGQDLSKSQGFVSHVCRNALRNEATVLRVPLETSRDFLHVDDAAARIARWLTGDDADAVTTKLIVSGVSTSLARTVGLVRAVGRRRTLLVHAHGDGRSDQPLYHRFRSHVLTDIDRQEPARPLEVGIAEVFESLRARTAAAGW